MSPLVARASDSDISVAHPEGETCRVPLFVPLVCFVFFATLVPA